MRGWSLHAVFATILIGSLAAREGTVDVLGENGNLELAVARVARSHGLTLRKYTTITNTDIRALEFDASGCARPVLIVLLSATFDVEPVVRSAREQDYLLRYVYIDRTWDQPRRLAVVIERIKYTVLATLGLTRYAPSPKVLMIESPPHCHVADDIEWRIVWDRDYLRASRSPIGTVIR
jgi:hypothetical protein